MSKRRIAYITISSTLVLATIFLGVHTFGNNGLSAHGQYFPAQKYSPKYSYEAAKLEPKRFDRVAREFKASHHTVQPEWTNLTEISVEDQLLTSMPTRAPPTG